MSHQQQFQLQPLVSSPSSGFGVEVSDAATATEAASQAVPVPPPQPQPRPLPCSSRLIFILRNFPLKFVNPILVLVSLILGIFSMRESGSGEILDVCAGCRHHCKRCGRGEDDAELNEYSYPLTTPRGEKIGSVYTQVISALCAPCDGWHLRATSLQDTFIALSIITILLLLCSIVLKDRIPDMMLLYVSSFLLLFASGTIVLSVLSVDGWLNSRQLAIRDALVNYEGKLKEIERGRTLYVLDQMSLIESLCIRYAGYDRARPGHQLNVEQLCRGPDKKFHNEIKRFLEKIDKGEPTDFGSLVKSIAGGFALASCVLVGLAGILRCMETPDTDPGRQVAVAPEAGEIPSADSPPVDPTQQLH